LTQRREQRATGRIVAPTANPRCIRNRRFLKPPNSRRFDYDNDYDNDNDVAKKSPTRHLGAATTGRPRNGTGPKYGDDASSVVNAAPQRRFQLPAS